MLFFMVRGIYPNENTIMIMLQYMKMIMYFIMCSKELSYGIPCWDRTYKSTLYLVTIAPKHYEIVVRKVRLKYNLQQQLLVKILQIQNLKMLF